jgi:membrane-bound lytic murein transglycosylase A
MPSLPPRPGRPPWRPAAPGAWRALLAVVAALLLASCAALFAPKPGLQPVANPAARGWEDDGDRAALEGAIARSIFYYARLPSETEFRYGEISYSPAEMIQSLELFQTLLDDPATLPARLGREFLIFESVAPAGNNLFTGYYAPTVEGAREPTGELNMPLYARPQGLIEVRLERFGRDLPPRRLMGRLVGEELIPYYSREEIQQDEALTGQAEPLAYVNEVDLFFLQIQGSGVIRFGDGQTVHVSYDGTNGHAYRSIGAELIRRNAMTPGEVTMQSIRTYLREHPDEARPLLFMNPSYVFFRVVEEGPLGNIEVPLTPGRSLAVDDRLFPKGSLTYIEAELPERYDPQRTRPLRRFTLVQDTGGVIKGHGRVDIFWGRGEDAEWVAGHLKHPGRLFLLVARKEALRAFSARD